MHQIRHSSPITADLLNEAELVRLRRARRYSYILIISSLLIISFVTNEVMQRLERNTKRDLSAMLDTVLNSTHSALFNWQSSLTTVIQTYTRNNYVWAEQAIELQSIAPTAEWLARHPAHSALKKMIKPMLIDHGYLGYAVISPQNITLSELRNKGLGEPHPLAEEPHFLDRVLLGETLISKPIRSSSPQSGANGQLRSGIPSMYIASPLHDPVTGSVTAVLAIRLSIATEYTQIAAVQRVGKSGETYLYNKAGQLLSESRFNQQLIQSGLLVAGESEILNLELRDPGGDTTQGYKPQLPRHQQPFTLIVQQGQTQYSGVNLEPYRDYRGVSVIGAWRYDYRTNTYIATEIDAEEAFHSLQEAQKLVLILVLFMGLLSVFIIIFIGSNRSRAIRQVSILTEELHIQHERFSQR